MKKSKFRTDHHSFFQLVFFNSRIFKFFYATEITVNKI